MATPRPILLVGRRSKQWAAFSTPFSLEQAQLALLSSARESTLSPGPETNQLHHLPKTLSPEGRVMLLWVPRQNCAPVPKELHCPPWLRLHRTGQSPWAICLILSLQSLSVTERPVANPAPQLSEQPESAVGKEATLQTECQLCPGTWHTDTGQTPIR